MIELTWRLEARQYREFGEDVQHFLQNLEVLRGVLNNAHTQTNSLSALTEFQGLKSLRQILGDYEATLNDCKSFLRDNRHFDLRNGVIYNMRWNFSLADNVAALRDRINIHDLKVWRSKFILDCIPFAKMT